MNRRFAMGAVLLAPLGMLVWAPPAGAQERWVATWAASPQQFRAFGPPRGGRGAPQRNRGPLRTPAAALPPSSFHDQTIRMTVRTSIGGSSVRVEFSNAFGTMPLMIGAAHVALHDKDSGIASGSDRTLQFAGKAAVSIPPGADMLSDPVTLDVPKLGDLAISIYLPGETGSPTMHATGLHTTYITKSGNSTGAPTLTDTTTSQSWYFLSGVQVPAPADGAAIVAYGDSITDGATSTVDTNSSWPSFLAQRLAANSATAHWAVLNEGISGNRLLRDGAGINALARLDRDVLAQSGVKWMTVMLGINDIGIGSRTPEEAVTADDVTGALNQIVQRAHADGIKVIGCTLTPYQGAAYYSDAGEVIREAVNQWIRTSHVFDAVEDFDAVVRDPANPKQIRADFNIRDHLHPNDKGYKAMADAIDLSMF